MMRKVENRHPLCRPLEAEEIETLEPLSKFHPYPDFRRRALGLLVLNSGRRVVDICEILRVSDPPVYNWAKGWREKGLVGILEGHKDGDPVKLTVEKLDAAVEIARQEPLTLAKIAARIAALFPAAPSFSLDRLSLGLKARALSFKRNRLSLKKRDETDFCEAQEVMNKIPQGAQEGSIELLYFDEGGFPCLPNVQCSGSPLAQPHTADASLGRKNIDPEITRRWQTEHKFFLLYLPPYSPELNLIEILWKHAKYHGRDFTSWTPTTLVREVQSILAGFGTKFHISFA